MSGFTYAKIAAGSITAAKIAAHPWDVQAEAARRELEFHAGMYRAGLGNAPRWRHNCVNCGAPLDSSECSYCLTVYA